MAANGLDYGYSGARIKSLNGAGYRLSNYTGRKQDVS